MIQQAFKRLKRIIFKNKQLIMYAICGVSALMADYLIFMLLYCVFKSPIEVAAPAGLVSGLIVSFLMNRSWTFSGKLSKSKSRTFRQLFLYILLFLFNNVFTIISIKALIYIAVPAAASKLISTTIITLWNYILYKKVIFR